MVVMGMADSKGVWAKAEQHISPVVGLCVHEIERLVPSALLVSRIVLTLRPLPVPD